MTLLTELYTEYNEDQIYLIDVLNESLKTKAISAAKFFSKNPAVTISAAALALSAYSKYKQSKRNTIRLFAKDAYEKKMMTDIVKALTQRGKFKLQKTEYANGGQSWVIKRL